MSGPASLVNVDVNKLGRVRSRRGWKLLGVTNETRRDRTVCPRGYDYLQVAIDDHCRYAYVEVATDER